MEAKDLLIADLEHFGESMWRNEDVGEKRLTFFVTLVTAVAAGLVALATTTATATGGLDGPLFRPTAGVAMVALFIIGFLSYLRMIQRNRVTDEYHRTLGYIRGKYASLCAELGEYKVPKHQDTWRGRWLRGGYAETFATIEGMLLAGFLALTLQWGLTQATVAGVVLAALLWWCGSPRAKKKP